MIAVLIVMSLVACERDRPSETPSIASPAVTSSAVGESRVPGVTPEIVSCAGLDIRFNENYRTELNRERGLLELSYQARRLQGDSVVIRYRDDHLCRRNPETRRLIEYAGAGREIAECLDLPGVPPDGKLRVELWFWDRTDASGFARALVVHRDIAATDAVAAATVRAWTEGPTEEEERAGASASAPGGTKLLGIDIHEGTAVVDLNEAFERTKLGTLYEGALLGHLAGTITQFDTVDRGLLKINGEFKEYYMGHGFIIDADHPLVRPGHRRYRVAQHC